jgi:hypothetical protein
VTIPLEQVLTIGRTPRSIQITRSSNARPRLRPPAWYLANISSDAGLTSVAAGDDPFLAHRSLIRWDKPRVEDVAAVHKVISAGLTTPQAAMSATLFTTAHNAVSIRHSYRVAGEAKFR